MIAEAVIRILNASTEQLSSLGRAGAERVRQMHDAQDRSR